MARVPIHRTRLSPEQAERILSQVWRARTGETVHPLVLRGLLALWDLETDQGNRMWNHNWGNLVLASGREGDHFVADDTGNRREFIAYASAEEGAADFIRELLQKSRWARGLFSGDPRAFAVGLKGPPAYYEASLDRYAKALTARWNRYPHLVGNAPSKRRRAQPKKTAKKQRGAVLFLAAGVSAMLLTWAVKTTS
jgi:hypothetical protein